MGIMFTVSNIRVYCLELTEELDVETLCKKPWCAFSTITAFKLYSNISLFHISAPVRLNSNSLSGVSFSPI
jgi:hypothetical protein